MGRAGGEDGEREEKKESRGEKRDILSSVLQRSSDWLMTHDARR